MIEHYSDDEVGVASDADALERQVAQSSQGLLANLLLGFDLEFSTPSFFRSRRLHVVLTYCNNFTRARKVGRASTLD